MEFLVRLAYIKFQGWQESLSTKLETLLDEVFKIVGIARKPVKIDTEDFSESDDDY